eukprot:939131_1
MSASAVNLTEDDPGPTINVKVAGETEIELEFKCNSASWFSSKYDCKLEKSMKISMCDIQADTSVTVTLKDLPESPGILSKVVVKFGEHTLDKEAAIDDNVFTYKVASNDKTGSKGLSVTFTSSKNIGEIVKMKLSLLDSTPPRKRVAETESDQDAAELASPASNDKGTHDAVKDSELSADSDEAVLISPAATYNKTNDAVNDSVASLPTGNKPVKNAALPSTTSAEVVVKDSDSESDDPQQKHSSKEENDNPLSTGSPQLLATSSADGQEEKEKHTDDPSNESNFR